MFLLAWNARNLQPIELQPRLRRNLNNIFKRGEEIAEISSRDVKFVGKCKYIWVNLKKRLKSDKKHKFNHYFIFNVETGR